MKNYVATIISNSLHYAEYICILATTQFWAIPDKVSSCVHSSGVNFMIFFLRHMQLTSDTWDTYNHHT
jgi:hypothetical protein